jgi:hypothetical protein
MPWDVALDMDQDTLTGWCIAAGNAERPPKKWFDFDSMSFPER